MRPESRLPELKKLTTFGIGGKPTRFFAPRTTGDVLEAAAECAMAGERCLVLGGGSNLLVDDDGPGSAVISSRGMNLLVADGTRLHAAAGVRLGTLVRRAAALGLSGLEPLAGIPGTLGGAVAMNAGGTDGDIGRVVERVEFIDRELNIVSATGDEMKFGYRSSRKDVFFITRATLNLAPSTPAAVKSAVRSFLGRKRKSQPVGMKSAGCMFRNPGRISAGFLIDKAGLKGFSVGDAAVSEMHANFIVNRDSASAADVMKLADFVSDTVKSIFGVTLELEVKIWSGTSERAESGLRIESRAVKAKPAAEIGAPAFARERG